MTASTSPSRSLASNSAWNPSPDLMPALSNRPSDHIYSPKRRPLVDLIQSDFPRTPSPTLYQDKNDDYTKQESDYTDSKLVSSLLNSSLVADVPPRALSTPPVRSRLLNGGVASDVSFKMANLGIQDVIFN